MYRLPKSSLNAFFAAIANAAKLYLPADKDGQAYYTEWKEDVQFSDKLNTLRSAKDFFFPKTQNLADFKINGKLIEVIDNRKESEDFVLFGVRACDAASFDILDKVFLSEPVDTYYKTRREHGVVITLACNKPEETCFCSAFGLAIFSAASSLQPSTTTHVTEPTMLLQPKKSTPLSHSEALPSLYWSFSQLASAKVSPQKLIKLIHHNYPSHSY